MIDFVREGAIASLIGAIVVTLTGCAVSSTEPPVPLLSPSPSIALPISPISSLRSNRTLAQVSPVSEEDKLTVQIYRLDPECEMLIPTSVEVPRKDALKTTIDRVIEDSTTADFQIAGYRIEPESTGNSLALDFRLSPQSQRLFVSLSTCEKVALLGSLRETLTQQEEWEIEEVRFTHREQPIEF